MTPSEPNPGRRRPRGEGAVFQRCEPSRGCPPREPVTQDDGTVKMIRPKHKCRGQWIGRLDLDDGSRVQVSGRTKNLAMSRLEDAKRQVREYGSVAKAITVSSWVTEWLDHVADLRPNTRSQYRSVARNYITPAIGKRQVRKVQPADVRKLLTSEPLASLTSTRRQAYILLNGLFADAKREGYASRNIMEVVRRPEPLQRTREGPTTGEARQILAYNATSGDRLAARWAAVFFTLQRQGECLGLEWDRVLWDDDLLDVSWQLDDLPYKHGCGDRLGDEEPWPCRRKRAGSCPDRVFDIGIDYEHRQLYGALCLVRPKTKRGERVIPMLPSLRVMLERRWELYQQERPGYVEDHGLVFTRPNGRPITAGDDGQAWKALLDAAGVPPYDLHGGRHTGATLLLEAGVPDPVVQKLMGHAKAATSHGYQHADVALLRRHMIAALETPLAIEGT